MTKEEQDKFLKELAKNVKKQKERFLQQDIRDCFRNVTKCNCHKKLKYCKG